MTSYILDKYGTVVAIASNPAKSGKCRYAWQACREAIDSRREFNLVNARDGKVSNAKSIDKWLYRHDVMLPFAKEINPGDYFIESDSYFEESDA